MTEQEYRIKIDSFFNKNYDRLLKTADDHIGMLPIDTGDLLVELYKFMINKKSKLENMTENKAILNKNKEEEPLLLFGCKWLINNIKLYKPNKKGSNVQGLYLIRDYIVIDSNNIDKFESEDEPYKITENDKKVEALLYVIENELDMSEKALFKLKYIDKYTTKKIIELIPGTTIYSINLLIEQLYLKIEELTKNKYYM